MLYTLASKVGTGWAGHLESSHAVGVVMSISPNVLQSHVSSLDIFEHVSLAFWSLHHDLDEISCSTINSSPLLCQHELATSVLSRLPLISSAILISSSVRIFYLAR